MPISLAGTEARPDFPLARPARLLLDLAGTPVPKFEVTPPAIVGPGQQVLAFGIHEDTGKPSSRPGGETCPDVPRDDLPEVTHALLLAVVAEARALAPEMAETGGRGRRGRGGGDKGSVPGERGLVVDGRDAGLSRIVLQAVHDGLDRQDRLTPTRLAMIAWDRFVQIRDLSRPTQDGGHPRTARPAASGRSPRKRRVSVAGTCCSIMSPAIGAVWQEAISAGLPLSDVQRIDSVPRLFSVATAKPSLSGVSVQVERRPQFGSFSTSLAGPADRARDMQGPPQAAPHRRPAPPRRVGG